MRTSYGIVVVAAVSLLFGCDTTSPTDFESEIVIEAYLEAGKLLPEIRVSRTIPLDAAYDAEAAGVSDAHVTLRLLDASGRVEESYAYRASGISPGVYLPVIDGLVIHGVRPLRSYELHVEAPGVQGLISSRTLVPDTFSVRNHAADSIVYQASEPYTFRVSPTTYPGRQSVFLFTTVARDAEESTLTPFAAGLIRSSELEIEDLRERASPTLNEENFERLEDGDLLIRFPWLAVYFYGRNDVSVSALDDNLFDFIRSQSVQQGGSTLPPGEIPNVLEHVDGARGIFGSYARATTSVYVLRSPNE